MSKEIKLTKGYVTIVDDEDYEYLSQWKWHYSCGYASRSERIKEFRGRKRLHIHMHRVISKVPDDLLVDHINNNSLDNRKCNLRFADRYENARNKKMARNNSLEYKGIYVDTRYGIKWRAHISINRKQIYIGTYSTAEEAARAYDIKAKELFGDFANLNFPTEKNNDNQFSISN